MDRRDVCVHCDDCAGRSRKIERRGTGGGRRMLEGWNEPGVGAYVPALRQTNTGPPRVYISSAVVDRLPLPQLSLSPSHTLGELVALLSVHHEVALHLPRLRCPLRRCCQRPDHPQHPVRSRYLRLLGLSSSLPSNPPTQCIPVQITWSGGTRTCLFSLRVSLRLTLIAS